MSEFLSSAMSGAGRCSSRFLSRDSSIEQRIRRSEATATTSNQYSLQLRTIMRREEDAKQLIHLVIQLARVLLRVEEEAV